MQKAIFIKPTNVKKAIFLVNKSSNILCWNTYFDKMMEDRNIEELDEIISKEFVTALERDQEAFIDFEGQ